MAKRSLAQGKEVARSKKAKEARRRGRESAQNEVEAEAEVEQEVTREVEQETVKAEDEAVAMEEQEEEEVEEEGEEDEDEGEPMAGSEQVANGKSPSGLQIYWNLASLDRETRFNAVVALLEELNKQKLEINNSSQSGEGNSHNELWTGAEYALKRLIRGLESRREAARQGFSLALIEALSVLDFVRPKQFFSLMDKHLEVPAKGKGQDVTDILVGRLLAVGSLVRSPQFSSDFVVKPEEHKTSVKDCTEVILELAESKHFMREPAAQIFLTMHGQLLSSGASCFLSARLQSWLSCAPEEATPENLLLALRLAPSLRESQRKQCAMLGTDGTPSSFFSEEHLNRLLPAFKSSSHSHPRVHLLWHALLDLTLPLAGSTPPDGIDSPWSRPLPASHLAQLWLTVVEGALLPSSHERKHLALSLLCLFLPRAPTAQSSVLLSPTLLRCIQDALHKPSALLRAQALHCLPLLSNWALASPQATAAMLAALHHPSLHFHKLGPKHGGDLLQSLQAAMDLPALRLYLDQLLSQMCSMSALKEQEDDDMDANSEDGALSQSQCSVIEHISSLPRLPHLSSQDKEEVLQQVLPLLLSLCLSNLKRGPDSGAVLVRSKWLPKALRKGMVSPLTQKSLDLCKARLFSLLALPTPVSSWGNSSESRVGRVDALLSLCPIAIGCLALPPFLTTTQWSKEDLTTLRTLHSQLLTLGSFIKEQSDADWRSHPPEASSFALLLCVLLLTAAEGQSMIQAAKDLADLTPLLFPSLFPAAEGSDESRTEALQSLVEVLLSLLALPSSLLRSVCTQLFADLSPHLTEDCLLPVSAALLGETQTGGDEDEVEVDSELGEDEDDDSEPEEEEEEEVEEKTLGDVQAVTKGPSEQVDQEEDGEEEDDEGMDDDAMFRMDSMLAMRFRLAKEAQARKGAQKAAEEQLRLRALDLLEAFLRRCPTHTAVLRLMADLGAGLAKGGKTMPPTLQQGLLAVLQRRVVKAHNEVPKSPAVKLEEACSVLMSLLEATLEAPTRPLASALEDYSMWVFRVLHSFREEQGKALETKLAQMFKVFLKGVSSMRSHVHLKFVSELVARFPWTLSAVLPSVLPLCSEARSEFLRAEAFSLVLNLSKRGAQAQEPGLISLQAAGELLNSAIETKFEKAGRRVVALSACLAFLKAGKSQVLVKGQVGKKGKKVLSKAVRVELKRKLDEEIEKGSGKQRKVLEEIKEELTNLGDT